MSIELRPLGVACNLSCTYCYQNNERAAMGKPAPYDLEKMKDAVLKERGGAFGLFGGEALLVPIADLEDLFAWGAEQFGESFIQTNGTLVTEKHIQLFQRHNVRVGVSMDGPGILNSLRRNGSESLTSAATTRSQNAIIEMCGAGLVPSVIITLHRFNADAEHLPLLLEWVLDLDRLGIQHVRLHLLESDTETIRQAYALSDEENCRALLALASLQPNLRSIKFDLFAEMYGLMTFRDSGTSCVWNACDPYTTAAVRGIEGTGQRSNCGRTNKEGVGFVKSDSVGFERQIALWNTDQEEGGCKGCEFFLACKGHCPGTALDGDWRNRTEQCGVWKTLFARLEREMLAAGEVPASRHPKRELIEQWMIDRWAEGVNPSLRQAFANVCE